MMYIVLRKIGDVWLTPGPQMYSVQCFQGFVKPGETISSQRHSGKTEDRFLFIERFKVSVVQQYFPSE
jgi:hypothetical protein